MADDVVDFNDFIDMVDEKYEPFRIKIADTVVVLQPLLRVTKEQRKSIRLLGSEYKDASPEDQPDMVDIYQEWIRAVAETPEQAQVLIDKFGDRADAYSVLQEKWAKKTQPGEAKPSAN